jgi:hypothetical protein
MHRSASGRKRRGVGSNHESAFLTSPIERRRDWRSLPHGRAILIVVDLGRFASAWRWRLLERPSSELLRRLRIDLRSVSKHPRADVEFHEVRTDLNLRLSTYHRFDMNSSKFWSSESKRHLKAYVKVAAIETPGPGAVVNTRELGADSDQPDG